MREEVTIIQMPDFFCRELFRGFVVKKRSRKGLLRLRLHDQIKPPLTAQIINPYEVTPDEFAQNKVCFICSCKRGLNEESSCVSENF